jgi:hypothetical protein
VLRVSAPKVAPMVTIFGDDVTSEWPGAQPGRRARCRQAGAWQRGAC